VVVPSEPLFLLVVVPSGAVVPSVVAPSGAVVLQFAIRSRCLLVKSPSGAVVPSGVVVPSGAVVLVWSCHQGQG